MKAPCLRCGLKTAHRHMHDTAYGLSDTHMSGSERYECVECGNQVFAGNPGAGSFSFVLDRINNCVDSHKGVFP